MDEAARRRALHFGCARNTLLYISFRSALSTAFANSLQAVVPRTRPPWPYSRASGERSIPACSRYEGRHHI